MCDDTCKICNGDWPQNFLMVPLMVNRDESDEMTDSQVESYLVVQVVEI